MIMLSLLALLVCLVPQAAFAESIAGKWNLTWHTQGDIRHTVWDISQDGEAVSVTTDGQKLEGAFKDGRLELSGGVPNQGRRAFAAGPAKDEATETGRREIDAVRTALTKRLLDPTGAFRPEGKQETETRTLLSKYLDQYDQLLSENNPMPQREEVLPEKLGAMGRIANLGHQFSMINSGVNPEQARQLAGRRSQAGYYQRLAEEEQRFEEQLELRKVRSENIEDARKAILALIDVSTALGDERRGELTAFKDVAKIVLDSAGDLNLRDSEFYAAEAGYGSELKIEGTLDNGQLKGKGSWAGYGMTFTGKRAE